MERLLVVSNRLPMTITRDENHQFKYSLSSGGLVSALSGLKKLMSFTWIGWPGTYICLANFSFRHRSPIVGARAYEGGHNEQV